MKKDVKNGVDNINSIHHILSNKKIGLITNPTGINKQLVSTIDILNDSYNLTALFAPEHGVRGDKQAGDHVENDIDTKTNINIYSMYGDSYETSKTMLAQCDAVVFDIQDVGARFYTYLYTLTAAMKVCKDNNKQFIVLDRINPINGVLTQGTILDENFSSFVGKYKTPTRSGLTIGEFAGYINVTENINCDLTICKISGWDRALYFDQTDLLWVMPSPNIPTIDTAICYIGSCLFEGTNLSEGRGTTKPFELIGAPWLDNVKLINEISKINLEGFVLRECYFTPSFSKYSGILCKGIQIHITNRDKFLPFDLGVHLVDIIRKNHKQFEFLTNDSKNYFIDLLLGSNEIRDVNFNAFEFIRKQQLKVDEFVKNIRQYLLY